MNIEAATLDDLMHHILNFLVRQPFNVCPRRGNNSEVLGALIKLTNPRARLSRTETKGKLFSALGELLWYLNKTNDLDFIKYYIPNYIENSDDNKTIYGGYGPRLFNFRGEYNQIANIINLLKDNPFSRKAVIQLFDAEDIVVDHKDVPCTCTLQFFVRESKLHMYVSMRSNDAYLGFPHDVFSFTMLQEIVARTLDVELGYYIHTVGSLHLYETHKDLAEQYLNEGFQSTKDPMPAMPNGNPWSSISDILKIESQIRENNFVLKTLSINYYWQNIAKLLYINYLYKSGEKEKIKDIKATIDPIYHTYIENKLVYLQNNSNESGNS